MTTAHAPHCQPQQQVVQLAGSPQPEAVLISHSWSEVEEIQMAAEADQLSPCYSHGNTQLHSAVCLGISAAQFPPGNGM